MIFDQSGYPRPSGASDFADSSHLAGMLAVTNHQQQVSCSKYVVGFEYVRHPDDSRFDFSRDQAIPLISGLIKQGDNQLVNLDYVTGKDIMPPSVRGMVRISHGKKPLFYQSLWLKLEILWHSYVQPLDEPNQIIALCSVYGDEYLKLWTQHNKLWRWSIRRYWGELDGAWRGEKELGEHIIAYVESKL